MTAQICYASVSSLPGRSLKVSVILNSTWWKSSPGRAKDDSDKAVISERKKVEPEAGLDSTVVTRLQERLVSRSQKAIT
jgi:hypothetical protein